MSCCSKASALVTRDHKVYLSPSHVSSPAAICFDLVFGFVVYSSSHHLSLEFRPRIQLDTAQQVDTETTLHPDRGQEEPIHQTECWVESFSSQATENTQLWEDKVHSSFCTTNWNFSILKCVLGCCQVCQSCVLPVAYKEHLLSGIYLCGSELERPSKDRIRDP